MEQYMALVLKNTHLKCKNIFESVASNPYQPFMAISTFKKLFKSV